jgi:hypothetical protein
MNERPVAPGQVWWCDGVALSFEPYFKRRPVLIVAVEEDGTLVVMPLSSRRHYGQETAVLHAGGTSYMTGAWTRVTAANLAKPLGEWADFAAWEAEQRVAALQQAASGGRISFWQRLRNLIVGSPTDKDFGDDLGREKKNSCKGI